MNPVLVNRLNQILDSIGYTQNRSDYAHQYFTICAQQAVMLLIDSLHPADQQEFQAKLTQALQHQDQNTAQALIQHTFSRAEFDQAMEEVMYQDMQDLSDQVSEHLPSDKRQALESTISQFSRYSSHSSVQY